MYQIFIVSSGFLKKSGTLWKVRLLGVPEFYRFLWILEKLWYTLENETPRCTRILWFPLDFQKYLVHLGERDS